jgi:hypothetical protein|tara:strand:- start:258 stop:479 length:222 start_codon:yes stop_codon:yes gene_type:complete
MIAYKFVVKDIYTNEKREFELFSEDKDPRPVHKEGMRQIKFEEDIEKLYVDVSGKEIRTYERLVYDKRKGFLD